MKITVVKITTPTYKSSKGEKLYDLNLRQRKAHKVVFIDPWVKTGTSEYKKKLQEIFFECGELLDQTTTVCDVKADLEYTINGETYFHQDGIPYSEEIENMHLADICTYNAIVNSYAAGHYAGSYYCTHKKDGLKEKAHKYCDYHHPKTSTWFH